MTAEIVVMNRESVVLAADSAITIGETKTLNTANKVFMLIPKCPLGVLIYNNATLMGLPWEILIKAYRDYAIENKIGFLDLKEYAVDFLNYIEKNGSKFFADEQEIGILNNMVYDEYWEILKSIWKKIRDVFYNNAQISDYEINKIVTESIEMFYKEWSDSSEILPLRKGVEFRSQLKAKFEVKVSEIIKASFGNFLLSNDNLNKLTEIALFKFSKRKWKTVTPYTGLVFAGYGKDNLFPVCIEFEVYNYFCNTLVFINKDESRIGFSEDKHTAIIIPLAQDDVVHNILSGRIPKYETELKRKLIKKFKKEEVETILKEVHDRIWDEHTRPIISTIDILPKDELASVARTLVNLTSFMRHVSSDVETVGGPVDVAVISKKDGFIWIDRKHYFDVSKNIHFNYEGVGETHAEKDE